jgi:hypothetical protein
MKWRDAMILWNPAERCHGRPDLEPGIVRVIRHPGDDRCFALSTGACNAWHGRLRGNVALVKLLAEFHTLVVRDGLDPQVVHDAFLEIDEYRTVIAPDCPGAR